MNNDTRQPRLASAIGAVMLAALLVPLGGSVFGGDVRGSNDAIAATAPGAGAQVTPQTAARGRRMDITLAQAENQRRDLNLRYLDDPARRYTGFESQADGVNHVAFLTDDLERTIEFYTQVLRLKLLRVRTDDADPRSTQVFFDMGRGELLAFLRVYNMATKSAIGLGGFHHMALTIGREQYEAARQRLDAAHVPYTTISHEILDTITLKDPNGITVELSVWNVPPGKIR
jgi:catechol 2,3-dioxygenase-like lactoylglutathione lyase family enzyme